MFDSKPKPLSRYRRKSTPFETEPSAAKLIRHALRETGHRLVVRTPKAVYELSKAAGSKAGDLLIRNKEEAQSAENKPPKPPRTSINQEVSVDNRVVAYVNYDFDRIKAVSKGLDCTLNDLSLVLVSEALRYYFDGINERIEGDLALGVPLSTRTAGDRSFGNEVGVGVVSAHNTIVDLRERLRAIKKETHQIKLDRSQSNMQDNLFVGALDALSPIVIDLLISVLRGIRFWNILPAQMTTIVSNVPGPRDAVYFAGMPVAYAIPMIPVSHGAALNIGVNSMGDKFCIGFHACGEVLRAENIHYLTDGVNAAYEKLSAEVFPSRSSRRPARRKANSGRRKVRKKPTPKPAATARRKRSAD